MLNRGATIGIIGGGQLGRMLAMAAGRLGLRTLVLEPQPDCPAAQMANRQIVAGYDDPAGLAALAEASDVVTYEFENVPYDAVARLSRDRPVFPGPDALRVAQDRLVEKRFLRAAGLATADFEPVDTEHDLVAALGRSGGTGIVKTRRFGYDGKGQIRFAGDASDPAPARALAALGGAPAILESLVGFACEVSVIATRGRDGTVVSYEPARNRHRNGILASSVVPCGLAETAIAAARRQAHALADRLGYVGTLGLELFVMAEGTLLANEFAPRVHNSGHWTEAACTVSQFEQHIRAIAGWPLVEPRRHSDCVMENLIGDDIDRLAAIAGEPGACVHDYGKAEIRAGRKMGHVTRLTGRAAPSPEADKT
ncbi:MULTISPECIES: 5-(carboxyamino)imidazole ribonucleotide synthase [unclassified Roseitalea]|uniref:5-(carboxyamino)imidazole ribonucleotide synthase n=1 Tax=unclassified Roseitalea TaxID=2639107 RepID=UPI00273D4370|nr:MULTISPECIES: 5-(carboxyamino)imidazole ribonucleotide synthase [unclassified Roseitalea]